jgi:hypothetical protein
MFCVGGKWLIAAGGFRSAGGFMRSIDTQCAFLHFRCGTESLFHHLEGKGSEGILQLARERFHARRAAAALLKMAKLASDPDLAAKLVTGAANLKEQAGELPPPVSIKPPGVQMDGQMEKE